MEKERFRQKYLTGLTDRQQTAVMAVNGPILLLAVPGSGKTTVLIHRLGYLLHCCGIQPREIVTVTYTRAAAREMKERFERRFPEFVSGQLRFCTINALALEIVNEYARNHSGRPPFLTIDGTTAVALLRTVCQSVLEEYPAPNTIRELQTAISYAKNMSLTQEELDSCKPEIPEFGEIFRAYNALLVKNRQMDYDDQLIYACRILRQYPAVLAAFQRQVHYLCVDEAQDTSLLQHQLLNRLASANRNLFLVGDEDQSIYGFRAAYPQALTQFEEHYPDGKILTIENNFRSTPQIVAAANAFVGQNLFRYPKEMRPSRQSGDPIEMIRVPSQREEILYLRQIAGTCNRQTAILYRNNESCIPLLDYLERQGIPYCYPRADNSFFTSRVVTDVINLLKFAAEPYDQSLFLAVYSRLPLYLKREQVKYLCEMGKRSGKAPLELLAADPDTGERMKARVQQCRRSLAALETATAQEALDILCNDLGYLNYLENNHLGGSALNALRWIAESEPTARRLRERLAELENALQTHVNAHNALIQLSTIHSSKGLEYDQVYLLDVADGILPQLNPEDYPEQLNTPLYQEERRLFYVAMTRAREGLHLFYRMMGGSTFVEEVNARLPGKRRSPDKEFLLGERCSHPTYGEGVIRAQGRENVLVAFRQGGERLAAAKDLTLITRKQAKPLRSQSTLLSAKEKISSPLSLKPGDRVTHICFGTGTVKFADRIVTIRFDSGETRKFSLELLNGLGALEKL